MAVYTEDDRCNALTLHLAVAGSDVEIIANVIGDDIMLRVNKAASSSSASSSKTRPRRLPDVSS